MRIRTKAKVTEDQIKLLDELWDFARNEMRRKADVEDPAKIEQLILEYDFEINGIRNIIREHGFMEAETSKTLRKIKLYKLAADCLFAAFVCAALFMIIYLWTGVI